MKKLLLTFLFFVGVAIFGSTVYANDGESFEDLQKFQKEMEQTVQKIQKMTHAIGLGSDPTKGISGSPSDTTLISIEHWRIKFFQLLNNQKFVDSINKIWKHPQRNYVLYTQLGFFIFMIFFKAWRKSKASNLFTGIWVSFYCFVLFWSLSLFLIPSVMFGEPYQEILKILWITITH